MGFIRNNLLFFKILGLSFGIASSKIPRFVEIFSQSTSVKIENIGVVIVEAIPSILSHNYYSLMKPNRKNLIFIVDDDPDDRQLILDAFLENHSTLDYVFIEDGVQLMETLHATSPEDFPVLILLDLNMPGMMGLHALKEIRENKNFTHIPTIVLTTSTFAQDESSSYKLGASCFLHKPQSYKELLEISASIIRLWLS